ncbi:hypothetical protein A2U01_0103113, partial [Trifolium medium]|nr:hypothetical protein [Trifolium medium]
MARSSATAIERRLKQLGARIDPRIRLGGPNKPDTG